MIGTTIGIVSSASSLLIPMELKKVIDFKNIVQSSHNQMPIYLSIFILLFFSTISNSISSFVISREGDRQVKKIRIMVQNHLINLPLSFFDNEISGQLASRVVNDTGTIRQFMTQSVPSFIISIITTLGTTAFLVYLDWKMTFVVLLSGLILLVLAIPLGNITEKLSFHSQYEISNLNGLVTEEIQNIRFIKLNTAENQMLGKFNKTVQKIYNISIKNNIIASITDPLQTFITFGVLIATIMYGFYRVNNGTLSLGTLVSVVLYFFQMIPSLNSVMIFYSHYKQVKGSLNKIKELMELKDEKEIYNTYNASSVKEKNTTLFLKNASFYFGEKQVLKNINMTFENKQKIAIVGPSGSGKTTIINLITRLYPIKKGELLYGNKNSNNINLVDWRNLFSVVTQENSINSGTIRDNLVLGMEDVSDYEIEKSLQEAQLTEFIESLPSKINTNIGEHGVKLSGGQRQRLQIAHAILRKSPFIIFDEATANLDADSEMLVSKAMSNMKENRTVIAIAHRLSTIVDADKIYFVKEGTILACGNHIELKKSLPEYKNYIDEQMILDI